MKKGLILLIIAYVLILQMVVAQDKTYLKLRESVSVNGKNITFYGLLSRENSEEVNFLVDGVFGTVEKSKEDEVNGVLINVTGISKNPPLIIIRIRVPFNCGDGVCSAKEDYEICCKDCGCGLGARQACLNNICKENITHYSAVYECYKNADCNDDVACTADSCNTRVTPYVCLREQIDACVAGDSCCPKSCKDEEDPDCATVNRCMSRGECNDDNACTADSCEGTPRRCKYTTQNGCPLPDECAKAGTVNAGAYCTQENVWVNLKGVGKKCDNDYECIVGKCDYGKCGGLSFLTSMVGSEIYVPILYFALVLTAMVVIVYFIVTRRKIRQPKPPLPGSGLQ